MEHKPRRRFLTVLAGTACALLAGRESRAAAADPFARLVAKLTGGAPVRAGRVELEMPRLADNGHSVPVGVVVERPRTAADHVRGSTLLSGPNPPPGRATGHRWPRACRPEVST